ncbi:MAG TPA: phospho-N-acetylmuramoyl-pentapeptide-transferase [Candidatus Tumulicola sp.]|nr:phospho-N-acetylmuramoyl-pentapeptide-transferase [Candidatus Tumulicola sp.]
MLSPAAFLWLAAHVAVGGVLAAIVVPGVIAWQRQRGLSQQIYEDAPSSHAVKAGTPTMGGIAFAIAALAGALFPIENAVEALPLLCLVLAAACIGFADDYLILSKHRALGLRARAKFSLLAVAALGFVIWEATRMPLHGAQMWFGGPVLLPTWVWAILAVLAIVGAANAVNLTDGLDGLAAGSAIPPLLLMTYVSGNGLAASVLGACGGFLYYNRHPARIFMGDTGSLALGALLGGLAIDSGLLLLLPLIGVVFVVETLSVMAQVASFKMTGKRILKMSPLHHHFELSGWSESRVTLTFVAASLVAVCAIWFALVASWPRGAAH